MEDDSILLSYTSTMKKLLNSAFAVTILCGGFFAVTSAHTNNDCKEVTFDHETVCVSINQVSTDKFELIADNIDGTAATLRCDIMTPDSLLKSIPACNGTFNFDDSKSGRIKLWIRSNEEAPTDWQDKPNSNSSIWTYPSWMYDFGNEQRGTTNNSSSNTSNGDLDNFYLTTDDTTPSTNQYVDLTVKARDSDNATITDYTDTVNFKVYYKASGSSTWTQTTSSTYYTIGVDFDGGYDFTSSDDGDVTLNNFIKFKKNNYSYKVRVYDENDTTIYKEITYTVGSINNNNNNGSLDNLYLATDDTTPAINQYIDLTVKARDSDNATITDYTDTINFEVYYRSSSANSRTQTTSSSYYTMNSVYTAGYDFTSSDDGVADLTNFIKFKKNDYDYKVRVYDENDTSIYKEITYSVGNTNNTSNGSLDNFYLTTDDTTPTTNQRIDLSIKARDSNNDTVTDYTDMVNFKIYKKASGSSTWTLTTSSTDFEISSDYDNGYDFTSSDDGDVTLTNFIKFKKNNYSYKVRVYDENDTSIYKEITYTVGTVSNSSNGEIDNFYITASPSDPNQDEYVDVTVRARDNSLSTDNTYEGTVNFKVERKSGSSRIAASSSYYTLTRTSYTFVSSDNGVHDFSNLVRFRNDAYDYRLVVYDHDTNTIVGYKTFYLNSNTNDNSLVNGFSSTELDTVRSMHSSWLGMVSDLEDQYPVLRNSTTRQNRSDAFYNDMQDILDSVSNRTYDTYTQFYAGFLSWYSYTINLR